MTIFRLLSPEDLESRVSWLNEPAFVQNMSISDQITLESTRLWYQRVRETPDRYDFALEIDQKVVAMGGLTNYVEASKAFESYTFVNPLAHSKGYGTLTLYLAIRFAFYTLECNRVFAYIKPSNDASMRMHQKIGFQIVDNSSSLFFPVVKENRAVFSVTPSTFNQDAVPFQSLNNLQNHLLR